MSLERPLVYAETFIPGARGYAPAAQLHEALTLGRAAKVWSLGARVVSLQLSPKHGGGLWKTVERLPTEEPDWLLPALQGVGVDHPSSYGDAFHQLAPPLVPLKYTYNGVFSWWPGGPWSEARKTGDHLGSWYRYDLVSAYRWAATLGLPDPGTYTVRKAWHSDPGLWVCEILDSREGLPAVFRDNPLVVMSSEEIDAYKVRVRVVRGVTWRASLGRLYVERVLRRLPCAKQSGRAYWGRWAARDALRCWTPTKEWEMRNIHQHFLWAWLIVGRVRLRVWEASRDAAHVYVDEVVVPHELPESSRLGGWHLKEQYDSGVTVRRTGAYGPRASNTFTMQTGVPKS